MQRQEDPESLLTSQATQSDELQICEIPCLKTKVEGRQDCPVVRVLAAKPPDDLSSIPEDTCARKRRELSSELYMCV